MTTIRMRHVSDRAMRALMLISLFTAFTTAAIEFHTRHWTWLCCDAALAVVNATGAVYYHRKITRGRR